MENKRVAKKPLTVNLPDGRKMELTHVCDINIPGFLMTLTGHIIPDLKIASLIGIRPLCKVGCTVIFGNDKCNIMYNGRVILGGYKDPATDLWTLPITKERIWTTPSQNDLPQSCPRISRAPHTHTAQQERALFALRANASKQREVCTPVIVQPKDIHTIKSNSTRVPQKVPPHQQKADSQVPQSNFGNRKWTYEAPTPWNTEYHPKSMEYSDTNCASNNVPSHPRECTQQRNKCPQQTIADT